MDQDPESYNPVGEAVARFPDDEYQSFRRSRAENMICNLLVDAYSMKQESGFFFLLNNVQYSILAALGNAFKRRRSECLQKLATLPPKSLQRFQKFQGLPIPKTSKQGPVDPNFEYSSQTGQSNLQTDTNVYIESEFTSMGGSDRQIGGEFGIGGFAQRKEAAQETIGHFKNKSNNLEVPRQQAHKKQTFSGEFQAPNLPTSTFQKKVNNNQIQTNFSRARPPVPAQIKSTQNKQNIMRRLRETLEKEEMDKINRDFSKKKNFADSSPNRPREKRGSYEFSFANNSFKPDSSNSRKRRQFNGSFKKLGGRGQVDSEPNVEKKSAIGRVFYLLSRRFQNTQYKNFFLDQVEVLVYKHGIRDPKIMSLLQNLDLRFNISELCPEDSEHEQNDAREMRSQERVQRRLEKQMTKQNMRRLEHIMMLFRADQMFAPLIRHFSIRKMSYNRNFFVNLRMFAKLAPFRKLHSTVQKRVRTNQKAAFSQMLFYVKPNLRLLVMIYAISKVEQRHTVDAFRRIYAFYYERLQKESQERKEKGESGAS